jgi:hypothetical protein
MLSTVHVPTDSAPVALLDRAPIAIPLSDRHKDAHIHALTAVRGILLGAGISVVLWIAILALVI